MNQKRMKCEENSNGDDDGNESVHTYSVSLDAFKIFKIACNSDILILKLLE